MQSKINGSSLFPKVYVLGKFVHENEIVDVLLDQGGFFMEKEEWEIMKKSMDEAYLKIDYKKHNEEQYEKTFGPQERQRKTVTKKQEKPGYIYVMKSDTGFYKIGQTTNLNSRMKTLKTASPHELELICSFETDSPKADEKSVQKYFHSHLVRGEWYDFTFGDLKKYMDYLIKNNLRSVVFY